MIDKNMIFTANFKDVTIEILVGENRMGGVYYLPDDMFTGDLIIEGSYDNDLPSGLPLASSCKVKINTASFTQEMSVLGKWIRDNNCVIGSAEVPNIWIIRRAGNVDFIGVQQPAEKETHKPKEAEYEISLVSVFKIAMESVYLDLDTASLEKTTLNRQIIDYVKFNNDDISASITNIYGWGHTKTENAFEFFTYLLEKFNFAYKVLTRNTDSTAYININTPPITFYKQNRNYDNQDSPGEETQYTDLHLITEIWHTDNNNVHLQDLKGGYRKMIADRYKNYWNFINAFLEGLGMRRKININYDTLDLSITDIFINNFGSQVTINNNDLLGDANEIEESYKLYRLINNRNNTVFGTDKSMVSVTVAGGSTAKPTFEASCLLNTIGNTVQDHFANHDIDLKGSGQTVFTRLGLNDLSVADGDIIPWTQLYYWDTILGLQQLHKVSDYCKIGDLPSSGTAQNILFIDGKDAFNSAINQLQVGGLSEITNKINNEVLCKRQLWLKCTLPLDKANNSRLGYDYDLQLSDVFKPNYFYEDITFGRHGVLVNIKENLTKGECECLFFIRSDQWAG